MKGELPRGYVSQRELEIWRLVALGKTNKEIAAALWLSVRTVDHHRESLCRKIPARNAADLARAAIEHGVIQVDVRPMLTVVTNREKTRYLLTPIS